ncbi:MAG: hypothetical protein NT170_03880 [Candidatus Moranbacteria bacterium]|nr:hypothetical protein [Candidatus Moranbacteria bacterium]
MLNKNTLVLATAILLGSIALGVFYYASQVNKQKSIERQQLVKIEEDKRVEEAEQAETKKQQEDAQVALQDCLDLADTSYSLNWNNECKGQGLKNDCLLPQYNADSAEKSKKIDQDNCFKQFPQK